ncbi:MAG: cytochrome c [Methylobacteriaceae bacterium]|nr:cytochrome c [Methylobacteriaceae bacterium]
MQQPDASTLIRVVLSGSRGVATDARPTSPAMPPLGWRLDDEEVAAVITYVRNAWGNAAGPVAAGEVRSARRSLAAE